MAELERAFADIAEQNRLWSLAEDVALIGFWHGDIAAQDLHWSPQVFRILGLDPQSSKTSIDEALKAVHLNDRAWVKQAVLDAVAARQPFELEVRIVRAGGEERQCLFKGRIDLAERGLVLFGILQDITERKRIETSLRDRNRLLELAELVAEIGHWRAHFASRSIQWSDELFRILDCPPSEAPNSETAFGPIHPDDRARVGRQVSDAFAEGRDFEFEYRIVCRDGSMRDILSKGYVEHDDRGTPIAAFGIARNITAVKQAEAHLLSIKEAAEAAARAKSDFLANMSHELRTPMTGVLGLADLLLATPLDEEQRRYVETMRGSASTLLAVLNDVLDFSKIEAGQLTLDRRDFKLSEVVTGVIQLLRVQASMKGLLLVLDLPPDAPQALCGDPARIQQVLFNLIGNAIKFTENGEVCAALVSWRSIGASAVELKFEVADTGIGMDQPTIARLFQPFAQADTSTSRRFGGTGLGLSICRRLVEMMGGEIGVDARLGQGARFWFTLRLDRASRPIDPKPILPTLMSNSRRLEILVADDNEVNSMIICAGLEKLGHRVEAVENGRKAVDAVRRTDFDLILMDMQMPVLDGEGATREIRHMNGRSGRTPIVAVTADAILAHRERYLSAGIDDILIKPIDWARMRNILEAIAVRPAATI